MIGQAQEIDGEGGHERGMMRGDEARVGADVDIAGGQMFGVVVGGVGGGAIGVFDEGTLQLVGNDAELVAAHVEQDIDAGVDADRVGRGHELAVGGESELMGVGNDPLGVGGGDVGAYPDDAGAEVRGVFELARGVVGAELDRMRAFAELRRPAGLADQQAPVIGGADGVEEIDVRPWVGVDVDVAAALVGAGNDSGDAHVEEGVGLALRVDAGKAINEAGEEVFPCAVEDARLGGMGRSARAPTETIFPWSTITMESCRSRAERPQLVTSMRVPPARTSGASRGGWDCLRRLRPPGDLRLRSKPRSKPKKAGVSHTRSVEDCRITSRAPM